MPAPFFFLFHSLFMAASGIVLAAAVLSLALLSRQGQRLHILLLLSVVPATLAALVLPFSGLRTAGSLFFLSFLQGVLIGPIISLAPLTRLKNTPSTWATTAQELGANKSARFRLLWFPLLGTALAIGLFLALLLSLLGTFALMRATLP